MTTAQPEDIRAARALLADEIKHRLKMCMLRAKELVERGATMDERTLIWTLP